MLFYNPKTKTKNHACTAFWAICCCYFLVYLCICLTEDRYWSLIQKSDQLQLNCCFTSGLMTVLGSLNHRHLHILHANHQPHSTWLTLAYHHSAMATCSVIFNFISPSSHGIFHNLLQPPFSSLCTHFPNLLNPQHSFHCLLLYHIYNHPSVHWHLFQALYYIHPIIYIFPALFSSSLTFAESRFHS